MPAKLRVTPLAGEPFELTIGNTATIGRTSDNTVCLSGSPLVSRQHALIRCHNGYQYQIIDLGSRNGTYVNGQRVVMPMTLAPGARVEVAKNEIIFDLIEDDFSSAHLEVTMAGSMAGVASAIRPVALLVCDIRGFSTMAEKISSSHLAQQLGVWFREAGNLVTQKRRHGRQIHRRRRPRLLERMRRRRGRLRRHPPDRARHARPRRQDANGRTAIRSKSASRSIMAASPAAMSGSTPSATPPSSATRLTPSSGSRA